MARIRIPMFAATCLAALVLLSSLGVAQEEGFESLFNGKDLTGWKVSENEKSVYVEDGVLVTHGKRGHAFYVGDGGKATFTNFHFKAKVKTAKNSNSGIYFHTEFQEKGWPQKGYECQVNNTHSDVKKTGGLYAVDDNLEVPVKDDVWFDYEIMVQGKHVVVKINEKTITDYTEPDDVKRGEGYTGRLIDSGTFALQAHDPVSKVWFKEIIVKRLP